MKNIIHLCTKAWVNTGLTQFGDEDTTFMTYIFFFQSGRKSIRRGCLCYQELVEYLPVEAIGHK